LQHEPRVIVINKLASYQIAQPEMLASVEQRQSK
jgi:hypothetical protein